MADKSIPQNTGGQYALTASTTTETAIYTGGGRVCQVVILTAGTAANSLYDGTNSTTGKLIWTDITNRTVGQVVSLQIPVDTGIVVKGTTGSGGVLVTFNKTDVSGL